MGSTARKLNWSRTKPAPIQVEVYAGQPLQQGVLYECESFHSDFEFHPENRDISVGHVRKLAKLIAKHGYDSAMPIMVGNGMIVYDGQHRLEACKLIDKPFYFVYDAKGNIERTRYLNSAAKVWSLLAYMKSHAVTNENYALLLQFLQEEHLSPRCFVKLLASGHAMRQKIKDGDFIFHDDRVDQIQALMAIVREFAPFLKKTKGGNYQDGFVTALHKAIRVEGFSWERALNRLTETTIPQEQLSLKSEDMALKALEDWHNYGKQKRVKLVD